MCKLMFSCCFLMLCAFAQAQLPNNFNLIPNSKLNFIYKTNLDDTLPTPENGCWFRANECAINTLAWYGTPYYHTDSGGGFRQNFHGPLTNWAWFLIKVPDYVPATNTFLDTIPSSSSQFRFRKPYVQIKLLEPLISGHLYHLSIRMMGVNSVTSPWITNHLSNIGAYFSVNKVSDFNNPYRLNVTPQINFKNWTIPQSDTFQYVFLTDTFTAAGGEQYVTIGNFDYFKDYHFAALFMPTNNPLDTIRGGGLTYFDDLSLVSDTTQPMISLDHFSLGNDTTLCAGQTMTIGGEPNFFHYLWNTGDTSRFITINTPGTYWCSVDYGCSYYTDTLIVYPPLSKYVKDTSFTICAADTPFHFAFYIPNNYPTAHYHWSNGATTDSIAITQSGTYSLYRSDACATLADSLYAHVQLIATPSVTLPNDTFYCNRTTPLLLHAGAGYNQYLWSTGDTTESLSVNHSDLYWVQVQNSCGMASDSTQIAFLTTPPTHFLGNDTSICPPNSIWVTAPAGYQYHWSTGDTHAQIAVQQAGSYSCTLSNACGTATDSFLLSLKPKPSPATIILGDTVLCKNGIVVEGDLYTLSPFHLLWSTGDTSAHIHILKTGLYTLKTYNECGDYTASTEVVGCHGIIAFPTAFSPNGDGRNDWFGPVIQDPYMIGKYEIEIFNRWGQQVFISFDYTQYWDGHRADIGTYYYICHYTERGKPQEVLKGDFELLR